MDLTFLGSFEDKYLQTTQGRGVFLAGVLLGYMTRLQVTRKEDVENAPLFKQMHFGRMGIHELKKHLSRVPELIKAYNMKYSSLLQALANTAGEMLLKSEGKDLGVDGNFAFTVGFTNAPYFFWEKIFRKEEVHSETEKETNEKN